MNWVILRLFVLSIVSIGLASAAEFRTWTNKDGRTVDAQMLKATSESVSVRLRNGQTYEIPIVNLSAPDLAYIAAERIANDPLAGQAEGDLIRSFINAANWSDSGGKFPGKWREVSKTESEKIYELSSRAIVLGQPATVKTHLSGDNKLTQIVITYLEEGNFVGYRGAGAVDPSTQSSATEPVDDRKKAFDKKFKELDAKLSAALTKVSGAPGKKLNIGRGDLRKRILQFAVDDLVLNLDLQDGHLVALKIQRAENFNRRMIQDGESLAGRAEAARKNVIEAENGDVRITNIPMIEQGSRGYCAMGTLAMITRYYRMNLDIDGLAAAGGFSEGAPTGSIQKIYEEAAKLARLRYKTPEKFEFRRLKRLIDRGQPVLVWRWFSYERDAFHMQYAGKITADPSVELPKANRADKAHWPKEANGGHASLVTGYNSDRGEVFFTESWSNQYQHRRMRIEEMEATVYSVFTFAP